VSDIVQILRDWDDQQPPFRTMYEAADEIERLRNILYQEFKPNEARPHEIKWMRLLNVMAMEFSTCSKRQYAAVILAPNKRVIGFGYNGSPPGMAHCNEGACPRMTENSDAGSKYDNCISQHAEMGAITWSDPSLRMGSTIIINGTPCYGCTKHIASSGISRVVYKIDSAYAQHDESMFMLQQCGIETCSIEPS
jgi:dCMP deaminase